METSTSDSPTPLPQAQLAGWCRYTERLLGRRRIWGGAHFRHGKAPQLATVRCPDGETAILVANRLGDVRLYRHDCSEIPLRRRSPDQTPQPLGYAATSIPDNYCYVTAIPQSTGFDLLTSPVIRGALSRLSWDEYADDTIFFADRQAIGKGAGIPALLDWPGGSRWLIFGQSDGRLTLAPLSAPQEQQAFSCHGHSPELVGRLAPQAMENGDLLIGDGDGYVWHFSALPSADSPCYDRGRRLVDPDGFLQVDGPASPALLPDRLLVADRHGEIHEWPLTDVEAWRCDDLPLAAGVSSDFRPGQWWRHTGEPPLLCAGPMDMPSADLQPDRPLDFGPIAPPLALRLPPAGYAEIHVTLRSADTAPHRSVLRVKLSGDASCEWLGCGETPGDVESLFVEAADVTGRDLLLSQLPGGMKVAGGHPVRLESIRVIPLPRPADSDASERRFPIAVGAMLDTMTLMSRVALDTPEMIDEIVAMHKRAGMNTLYMKVGGSSWEYPSRYPEARGVAPDLPGYTDANRDYCRRQSEMLERINRVELVAQACRRHGLRCFGWMRWQDAGEHISSRTNLDRFFVEHQHLCEEDLYGNRTNRLCVAYPEVQDYFCRIAAEAMGFGLDGLLMDTLRKLPKVMYGKPVREAFQERHGLDMRSLPPFDPRVVALQCEIHHRFIRALRKSMVAVKANAQVHLRVGDAEPLMGVDPATLARDGLVDAVLIAHRSGQPHEPDLQGLQAALMGTTVEAHACISRTTSWRDRKGPLPPALVERLNAAALALEGNGITYYESMNLLYYPELRRALSRFSRPDDMPSRACFSQG